MEKSRKQDPKTKAMRKERLLRVNRAFRAIAEAAELSDHPQDFLDAACAALVTHLDYCHAWAAAVDDDGSLLHAAPHTNAPSFAKLHDEMINGGPPTCVKAVLDSIGPVPMRDIEGICPECPVVSPDGMDGAWAAPMRFRGRVSGLLIAADHGTHALASERALLMDIAADIAAGLHRLEQQSARGAAEHQYRHLVDNLMGMVYRGFDDEHWTVEFLSAGTFELTGYEPAQLIANAELSYGDIIHPEDRERVWKEMCVALETEGKFTLHYRIVRADGEVRWVVDRGHLVSVDGTAHRRLEGLITDVTDQVAREEQAREATHHLEAFFDVALDLFCITDHEGRVLKLNRRWEVVLGYPLNDLMGANILDFVHPGDREATIQALGCTAQGESVHDFVNRHRHADGSYRYLEWQAHPHGTVNFAAARDVTERRKRERALEESEKRFRTLIEGAPEPIFVQTQGCFAYLNQAACELFGTNAAQELLGQSVLERFHPEVRDTVRERIRALNKHREAVPRLEERILRVDGGEVTVEVSAVPFVMDGEQGAVVFMHDITPRILDEHRRRKLESQLQQAQKMESVGRLAGGVAHDFNNLLVPILGHAELLTADLPDDHPAQESLREILGATERARSVASQLLAFSREKTVALVPVDLNQVVRGFQSMLGNLLGEDIELTVALDKLPLTIQGSVGQLEQVLLNLAVNARDAMPGGGKLRIETRAIQVEDEYTAERPSVSPGAYALLTVTDNGEGMDEATRNRIFDPFFTTKTEGKGTGLGLATVYGIVKQHGGHIWVYSEVGHGTSFRVYLPLDVSAGEALPEPAPEIKETDSAPVAPACILVLEDLAPVRVLVVKLLSRMGHTVLEAGTFAEAKHQAGQVAEIDLMISDVILPDCQGPDAYKLLRETHPEMRIIFMSGYTESSVLQAYNESGLFLQKPFTTKSLVATVSRALAAEPPPIPT